MKTAGIDIGTTTISGVVLEKEENGQAKILEAKTVENGCFIETGNEWERIQYAKEIVENSKNNKSKVVIVPNSNHTFNVLIPNASKANDVIEITLKWIKNILQTN